MSWSCLARRQSPAEPSPPLGLAARPSLDRSYVVFGLLTVLCPAPTPSRLADARTEEGLSSSSLHYLCIPRPLHRGVLDGCTSQGFPASVAFARYTEARLPLAPNAEITPRRVKLTMRQTSRHATDCRFACLPFEDVVSGLHRRDFSRDSLRCRSATRRLGPYRDRTFTGKFNEA